MSYPHQLSDISEWFFYSTGDSSNPDAPVSCCAITPAGSGAAMSAVADGGEWAYVGEEKC
jgi:hypothetical protein